MVWIKRKSWTLVSPSLTVVLLTLINSGSIHGVVPFLRTYSYPKNQPTSLHYAHNRPSIWMTKHPAALDQPLASDQPTDEMLFDTRSLLNDKSENVSPRDSLSSALNAIDPGTYYADWHQMLHGQGTYRCVPIPSNMSLCQNVGYRRMVLPNYLQHEELKEAVDQSQVWVSLAHTECHPDLNKFLCALYAPVCVEEFPERLINPCGDLCEDVRKSCLPKMLQFGFGWPEIVKCSRFPASSTKMCIPLTAKKRPRCSGCVEQPTFESVVSSYCMAEVALRARIMHVSKTNDSTGAIYLLQLDRRPKVLKLSTTVRRSPYLNIEVSCDCAILDKALTDEKGRLGRWLIMGKLSADQKTLQVEHLSRIRKQNRGLRRAMRAIRRPAPNLCQLTLPNSQQPIKRAKSDLLATPQSTDTTTARVGVDSVQKRSIPRLRVRAHAYEPHKRRVGSNHHFRSTPTAPTRRSLVRRSQKYPGRPTSSMTAYVPYATQNPQFVYSAERRQTPLASSILSAGGLNLPTHSSTIPRGNALLETEKDLFAPQNLIPWL